MNRILIFIGLVFITACIPNDPIEVGAVEGLKPIYISAEENVVEVQDARGFENLGKIVYSAPYLLVNERFKGIHIINNSDPSDPKKIAFLQIPGNTDFTIKGQYLYANHGNDLKTFLLSNTATNIGSEVYDLQETQIIANLFADNQNSAVAAYFPPDYEGFFECVSEDAGILIGWDTVTLINPECRI